MQHRWTKASAARAGRIGGLMTRSRRSATEITAPARKARTAQINDMAGLPEGLDPTERDARLRAYRSAYFGQMSIKGVKVRQANAARRTKATPQQNGATPT